MNEADAAAYRRRWFFWRFCLCWLAIAIGLVLVISGFVLGYAVMWAPGFAVFVPGVCGVVAVFRAGLAKFAGQVRTSR